MTHKMLELLSRFEFIGWRDKRPRVPHPKGTRKIRVLHVIREGRGRPARQLQLLLEHLDRTRFESAVVASSLERPEFLEELRRLEVHVHVLDIHPSFRAREDFEAANRVMTILRGGRYDIAHLHGWKAAFVGRPAGRVASVRAVVHTPHGFPFLYERSARLRKLHVALERAFGRLTDAMICASKTETETALRLGLIAPGRVHTVYDGVATSRDEGAGHAGVPEVRRRLNVGPGTRLVLMSGRLAAPKDPGTLLRAARHVLERDGRLLPRPRPTAPHRSQGRLHRVSL